MKVWRTFRGWRTRWQIVTWVALAFVALALVPSGNNSAKAEPAASALSVAQTTETTTPTVTPVDVTDTTATVLAHVKQRFPKATVVCDGETGEAVCSVTLNDFLNTVPMSVSGASASRIIHLLAPLPTAKAEAKARAQAKAEAKAEAKAAKKARKAAKRAAEIANATVAQQQALQSAQSYLDMGGFSLAGLMKQLTSSYGEGFSTGDAKFAVSHVRVNWNEQAVISARSYLEMGGFSRDKLIQQLTSSYGEGFTYAQAVYAANRVGL
jgi:hypothetical protein